MEPEITFSWPDQQPDRPPVRIRTLRPMFLRPVGEETRPVKAGEDVTISYRDFRTLGADSCEAV